MKLLAGNSNLPLARAIADYLDMQLTSAAQTGSRQISSQMGTPIFTPWKSIGVGSGPLAKTRFSSNVP